MDLPKLQALIAPVATPVAPALLLGNEMYQVMVAVDINWALSMAAAFVAIIGLESAGALASYMAVKAWGRRDWGAMVLSMAGALLYAAIVMGGVALMPEARARVFGVMVFVTLVAYLGYGLYHSYIETEQQAQRRIDNKRDLMKEERLLINAQTRQIKATGHVSSVSSGQLDTSTGQVDTSITPIGQKVLAYLDDHPGASQRAVARDVGCSPTTAGKWYQVWLDTRGQ